MNELRKSLIMLTVIVLGLSVGLIIAGLGLLDAGRRLNALESAHRIYTLDQTKD